MKSGWIMWIFLGLVILFSGYADEDARYKKIRDALHKFTYTYPQQKVYLHLDKLVYKGGDNLWVKAYLVNGIDHNPDTFSTNLYVELISPFQTRVEIKRFQMFDGFGIGDFMLSDTLPEGLYQIRAYTSWMQNFDPEFYFTRNFQLNNPVYRRYISPKQARMNQRELEGLEKAEDEMDLQFMPEGGYLVEGLESEVAFKAINRIGRGVSVEGVIADDKGATVASFKSQYKGIGTFTFTPGKGKNYTAIVRSSTGEKKTPLPKPLESGMVMHADVYSDRITLRLVTNRPPTNDPTANEVIMTGQVGGRIYYQQIIRLENREATFNVSKALFPGGILQFTAFSGRGIPLCERLVFIQQKGYMSINFTASDTFTQDGKKILLEIHARDNQMNPLAANFSLSVTRELSEQPSQNNDNILSNFFITSDLKGFVEDPLDYLELEKEESLKAIDNLMLTHGWRRFDWASILEGNYPVIKQYEEQGLTVLGMITHDFFSIPLKNCKVRLSIMDKYNDVFTEYSSKKGIFVFDNLVYYDTISVKIEAWRPSGRRNLVIQLPEEITSAVMGHLGDYSLTTLSERDNKNYRIEKAEEFKQAFRDEQIRLQEEQKNDIPSIYSRPDYVLHSEDIADGHTNILDAMKGRIPGVNISGNSVIIRGPSTMYGSTQPLFVLDGMPVNDVGVIQSIPVQDIDRVEILKGPSAAIYGLRGANGVVAVYTKRGHFMKRGIIEFDMLGYSTPRVFYQPKYKIEEEPAENFTLLWKPVIITNSEGNARVVLDKPLPEGNYRFDLQGLSYSGHAGYANTVIYNQ